MNIQLPHAQFHSIYDAQEYLIFTYQAGGIGSSYCYEFFHKESAKISSISRFNTLMDPNLFNLAIQLRYDEDLIDFLKEDFRNLQNE